MGNREIKFRAFDPKNGMIEPYSVRNGKAFIIKRCNKDDPEVTVNGVNFYCNWDIDVATDFPVMQFTGWNDAEGEPIFEGDILVCEDHFYYEISWSEKHACWYASDCGGLDDLPSDVRVIGNIYQNPELLNG